MQRANVAEMAHYDFAEPPVSSRKSTVTGVVEVSELWRILSCRRNLILGVTLLCGIGALIYVMFTPSEFTATAQILIDPRDRQIVTKDVNPDTLASDGGILQVESQSRVIESDAVLLRAVRALGLADDPDYGVLKHGLVTTLLNVVSGAHEEQGPAAAEERALRVLRKHLAVKRADKVFVVDVVVTAFSGVKAARIADAIAEAYQADQLQSRSESSSNASQALASRLVELRRSVETAADQVERFKASHDLLGTDKQLISDQELNDNGTQLNNARAKVAELQARADQLDALRRSGADAGAMPEAIQSSVITQLRSSQSELTRRRSDMRTRFGDRHPDLIAIDAEINQTHRLIAAELDRLVRSAHSDLDRAKKNEQALSGSQDALKRQTISSNQAFITLQELVRELDARRSVYQAFLARAGETKEQSSIDNTNARIISRAIPPVLPSWPLRAILLLGAIGGGLGIGAALAFGAEHLAPTILSAGQLEEATHAPTVGTIAGGSQFRGVGLWPARLRSTKPLQAEQALGLVLCRLCGPLAALKTRPTPHTILMVSARGAAGMAARLVRAAAESHVSVLLVDGESGAANRHPSEKGLHDVLRGESSLKAVVTRDDKTGIFRLGLGEPVLGEPDALSHDRCESFFKLAGRNFDLIIFDGGTNVEAPGVAALTAAVEDVLFVALRGQTPQKEVIETADAVVARSGRPLSAALLVDRRDRV